MSVWKDTSEERDKGWLLGPWYSDDELRREFGEHFVISRRFGLVQGPKTRPIDDYSESQVNATISAQEKVELQTVDDMVAVIKCALQAILPDRTVCIQLANGTFMRGKLPEGVSRADAKCWLGKCFDLKSAYRQIPTKPDEAWATCMGVWDPVLGKPAYFRQLALPFGAVGSVYGFNRLSRAIWAAGSSYLRLAWCNYYDDYPSAELKAHATVADLAVRAFFALLGWTLATEEAKCKPYFSSFVMLGCSLQLDKCPKDIITVGNKPERIEEISGLLCKCVTERKCSQPVAATIGGKCQFASGQVYGRLTLGLLHVLSVFQHRSLSGWLDDGVFETMASLNMCLLKLQPRTIDLNGPINPILSFTDGAVEGLMSWTVTVGGVVLDTVDERAVMFGERLPLALVRHWRLDGNVQTIGQAELLPVLLAKLWLGERARHRRIFYFIDNDSARQALVKGYSNSRASSEILNLIAEVDVAVQSWSWYARVPTDSNPGDGLLSAPENLNAILVPTPDLPDKLIRACDEES